MGGLWHPFSNGLNKVAVHDLVIQSQEKDLLLATHGRSIYKTDLSVIYNYLNKIDNDEDGIVYKINDINYSNRWGSRSYNWSKYNEPKLKFYVFSNIQQTAKLKLINNDGLVILKKELDLQAGFQEISLDLNYSKEALRSIQLMKSMKNRTKIEIKKSDNGEYYFKKGDYRLFINNGSESFQIK
jgi:hypothetical protein